MMVAGKQLWGEDLAGNADTSQATSCVAVQRNAVVPDCICSSPCLTQPLITALRLAFAAATDADQQQ